MAILGAEVTQHGPFGHPISAYGSFAGKTALNLGTITQVVALTAQFDIGVSLTGKFDSGVPVAGLLDGISLTGKGDPT